jgi:succinoglycan biosynthesis transport protein ExoP
MPCARVEMVSGHRWTAHYSEACAGSPAIAEPSPAAPPDVSEDQDLRRYIRLLRNQWRLAAGIVLVCVLVAVAVALAQPNRYRASAKVLYAPTQSPALAQANQDPARAVATLAGLAATQDVLQRAAQALGVPVNEVRKATQTNSTINGDIIDVAASAPAATAAAAYANAVARALVAVRTDQARRVVKDAIASATTQLKLLGKPTASSLPTITTVRGQLLAAQSSLKNTQGDVTLVQPAEIPGAPSSPRPALNAAIGLLVGLLAAALVLLARDRIDRRPRTGLELEKLWQLPVIAAMKDVGTNGHVSPEIAESYRTLRGNLLLRSDGELPRVMLVTSAVEGEGKSAVAANLARALAASGQRVVAVSADLRRPTLQKHMAIASSSGIAEVLADDVYPTDVVTRVPLTGQDVSSSGLLDLLASDAKPGEASANLVGRRMEDLLGDLQDEYDIVVIDAPALLPASETVLLARTPGMRTLVVARIGAAQRRDIERARERLALAGVEPIGIVVAGSDEE